MLEHAARDIMPLLQKMDETFSGFYSWLAGQYDPESGGFYYARSSRNSTAFETDVESTAQAFNILERSGLKPYIPQQIKESLIRFFQNKQNSESGFFLDKNPVMKEDEVMVARAIGYTTGVLAGLGAEPLYPLPYKKAAAPPYMNSLETYRKWLNDVSLANSWRGCDRLATTSAYVDQLPEQEKKRFIQAALDYFAEIQDPETGLWGEGSLYVRISGTFKLHTFYSKFDIPMPNVERIYKSILYCLRNETAGDMCYIRNPINLLSYMKVAIPDEELYEIIAITEDNMAKLKREDGGFSREIGNSPSAPNVAQVKEGEYYPFMPKPVHLSQGLYEGDMNAGTQALLIRLLSHKLAGVKAAPLHEAAQLFAMMGY